MAEQELYMNSEGSRWTYNPRHRVIVKGPDNYLRVHNVDFYDAVGNFAAASVRVRGIRLSAFPATEQEDGLYVLDFRSGPNLKMWQERIPPAKERTYVGRPKSIIARAAQPHSLETSA